VQLRFDMHRNCAEYHGIKMACEGLDADFQILPDDELTS
jgi:hypothetical protein